MLSTRAPQTTATVPGSCVHPGGDGKRHEASHEARTGQNTVGSCGNHCACAMAHGLQQQSDVLLTPATVRVIPRPLPHTLFNPFLTVFALLQLNWIFSASLKVCNENKQIPENAKFAATTGRRRTRRKRDAHTKLQVMHYAESSASEQRSKRKRRLCERAKKSALSSHSRAKAAAAIMHCKTEWERDLWRKCCHYCCCCCCFCCWPPTSLSETDTRHQWSHLHQQATYIEFVCPVIVTRLTWGISVNSFRYNKIIIVVYTLK